MNDFVKWEIELNPNSTLTEDGTERDDPYADPDDEIDDNEGMFDLDPFLGPDEDWYDEEDYK